MSKDLKVAFAGVNRASSFFKAFQAHPETEIVALCDVNEATLRDIGRDAASHSSTPTMKRCWTTPNPTLSWSPRRCSSTCRSRWRRLQRDIHVLCEVTAAVSMDEARWLVQACKQSRAVYMMAENYTYMRPNVLVRAMVGGRRCSAKSTTPRANTLHELSVLHHTAEGKPTWRYYWQVGVNGCTYPTHSLGPCLQWIKERPARISCIGTAAGLTPSTPWKTPCCCSARRRATS